MVLALILFFFFVGRELRLLIYISKGYLGVFDPKLLLWIHGCARHGRAGTHDPPRHRVMSHPVPFLGALLAKPLQVHSGSHHTAQNPPLTPMLGEPLFYVVGI